MSTASFFKVENPLACRDWDDFVARNRSSTFFHSAAWAKVLVASYGFEPCYFVNRRADELSLLPVMEVNSRWTGRRGVGLPFTDEAFPLGSQDSNAALFEEIKRYGAGRKWKYFECRGATPAADAHPSISYMRHIINLSCGIKNVAGKFDGAVVRGIRKAEEAGIRVEKSQSAESVRIFYRLHEQTRRKHGLPPQPYSFFQQIGANVLERNLGYIFIAWHQSQAIAGAVFFHFGTKAIYKFGASNESLLHLRGNNAVMNTAIEWYAGNGFSELNLGRTEKTNEGLRRFKRNWGASEETLNYWRYNLSQSRFVTVPDRTEGWHNTIFRKLPGPIFRCTGELLYPHIG